MALKFLWDSCVCIDWIENKDPAKRALLRPIIDAATAGDVLIIASALVLSEVVAANGGKTISDEDDAKIRMFFKHPFVEVRPIDQKIGNLARDIMRARIIQKAADNQKFKKIPVNDAIHIATALECGCDCLHSFDAKDLLKEHEKHQLPGLPKLKIAKPSYTPPAPRGPLSGQKELLFEAAANLGLEIEAEVQKSIAAKASGFPNGAYESTAPVGEPPTSP